ncbi:MAG: VWA domain-containing protein [Phycisphaerales bacterium]
MPELVLEQPAWLLIALAGVFLATVGALALRAMSRARRISAITLRLVLFALLALALAGASTIRTSDRVAVVALVDVSTSVRTFATAPAASSTADNPATRPALDAVRDWLRATASARGPDALLGIIAFDSRLVPLAPPTPGRRAALLADPADNDRRIPDVIDRPFDAPGSRAEGTDLAGALRLARAMFPPDARRRIIIFSDGNQTQGDALALAETFAPGARDPIRIDVVPLSYRVQNEVIVESLDTPARASPGAVIAARVTLTSTGPADGILRVFEESSEVDVSPADPRLGLPVSLTAGRNVIVLSVPLSTGLVHRLSAVFEPAASASTPAPPADTADANNRAESFTITPGGGSVLVLDGIADADADSPGRILPRALDAAGIRTSVIAPAALTDDLLALQAFDAVILQNVPADALAPPVQLALQRYVTEFGGGLIMSGGPASFGAGGWRNTPIEPILPVLLDLPERLVAPPTALIIVLDTSGSMGFTVMGSSRTQQQIANEGAALAIETMDPRDFVGVIAFDTSYSVVAPLAPNTDPRATADLVRALSPGGGTNIPPALRAAYEQIKAVNASQKHVIVLTDGISSGRSTLPDLVRQMRADNIRVSTISVGDGADADGLAVLAQIGGGQAYSVVDPNLLPRVFLRAVRVVRTPAIRETPFDPLSLVPSPATDALPLPFPPLNGITLAQQRPAITDNKPTGVTDALITPTGEPLLSHWQAGLGNVAAFTSDAHNWAGPWLDWPGYARFWSQLVRLIARSANTQRGEATFAFDGDRLRIRVELNDEQDRPADGLEVTASIFAPDGSRRVLALTQEAPGVYAATAAADTQGAAPIPGATIATISARAPTSPSSPAAASPALRPPPPIVVGAFRPPGAEFRSLASNDTLLAAIARTAGGSVYPLWPPPTASTAALFDRDQVQPRQARLPLWTLLIWLALAVLLLDIATRRIAWDRLLMRDAAPLDAADSARRAAQTLASLTRAAAGPRSAQPAPGVPTLTSDDAARVAQAAADRRRADRLRAAGLATPAPASPGPGPAAPADTPAPPAATAPQPAADESPLQAAKRRARERIDGG